MELGKDFEVKSPWISSNPMISVQSSDRNPYKKRRHRDIKKDM